MILDQQQIIVQKHLLQLKNSLELKSKKGFLQKILTSEIPLKSLYIHGDVGRGKSMLVREFFNLVEKTPKVSFHFNGFMRLIHEALRDIRKENKKFKDELIEATKRVVKKNILICFDEFQVLDIADAMLLSRIFTHLFQNGRVVIFTSNSAPLELYKNGLQRELFLEFVKNVLLKNCDILHLNSSTDYRSIYAKNLSKRYFISNEKNRQKIKEIIIKMTDGNKLKPLKIKVWGREIKIKKTHKNIAVFNFDDLCRVEFSASDYQAICQKFEVIFLLKIPRLLPEDANEARRFIVFIDEAYEKKTNLIILAKTNPNQIYENGSGSEAFKRTVSRLNEMKSDNYLQQ